MADCGKVLLRGRRGSVAGELFNVAGDMHGGDGRDRAHAVIFAPKQKLAHGQAVGAPRVPIADVGSEEFKKALLRARVGRRDDGW
jgi:hypothetical protein